MKMFDYLLFAVILTATGCSSEDSGDQERPPSDISSGVQYQGEEIILADRNVGALRQGDIGTLFTAYEAETACPEGYHLLNTDEIELLIADSRYNWASSFRAAFMIPWTLGENNLQPLACYYRAFGEFGSNAILYFSSPDTDDQVGITGTDPLARHPVRCAKGTQKMQAAP